MATTSMIPQITDPVTGEFVRKDSSFRNWITSEKSPFPAEKNRYHLYVSLACPWAHRTLIMRKLKGLEEVITVDVVDWLLGKEGWSFDPSKEACTSESIHGFQYLKQVYFHSQKDYEGRYSVPILYDKKEEKIVNNESSEIIRMLNSEFNAFSQFPERDLYPESLRDKIDKINEMVYQSVNNGVYKCGFAASQEAYDKNVTELFKSLDKLEELLSKQRYLCGDVFTEADIRLWVTLIRFDAVYVQHFKCNLRRIQDYPNLSGFLREIYQIPLIKETVNIDHIKKHYMCSHGDINKYGIVAMGPLLDFDSPPGRDKLPGKLW